MVKVNLVKKRTYKNQRHIRWNWQKSPDSEGMVRVHLVIVDDKNRLGKIEKILEYAMNKSIIKYPFDSVHSSEGKVKGTKLRYLFNSYDTQYSPDYINPKNIFSRVIKDNELYERKRGDIKDYVARLYE